MFCRDVFLNFVLITFKFDLIKSVQKLIKVNNFKFIEYNLGKIKKMSVKKKKIIEIL